MSGWICLHRKMLDWEWYSDPNTFRLFMHLLLTANHKDQKWRGIDIRRGQVLTGRTSLAEAVGLSVQAVRTSLQRLKSTGEITIKSTNKYSIITITNWEKYQEKHQQDNQQSTSNQPAINQQSTTNNNVNNANNEDNEEGKGGASAQKYVFEGKTVRLTEEDYQKWEKQFHKIKDFRLELEAADTYYSQNPAKDGKWFFPVFNWLKKAHNQVESDDEQFRREQAEIYRGVV